MVAEPADADVGAAPDGDDNDDASSVSSMDSDDTEDSRIIQSDDPEGPFDRATVVENGPLRDILGHHESLSFQHSWIFPGYSALRRINGQLSFTIDLWMVHGLDRVVFPISAPGVASQIWEYRYWYHVDSPSKRLLRDLQRTARRVDSIVEGSAPSDALSAFARRVVHDPDDLADDAFPIPVQWIYGLPPSRTDNLDSLVPPEEYAEFLFRDTSLPLTPAGTVPRLMVESPRYPSDFTPDELQRFPQNWVFFTHSPFAYYARHTDDSGSAGPVAGPSGVGIFVIVPEVLLPNAPLSDYHLWVAIYTRIVHHIEHFSGRQIASIWDIELPFRARRRIRTGTPSMEVPRTWTRTERDEITRWNRIDVLPHLLPPPDTPPHILMDAPSHPPSPPEPSPWDHVQYLVEPLLCQAGSEPDAPMVARAIVVPAEDRLSVTVYNFQNSPVHVPAASPLGRYSVTYAVPPPDSIASLDTTYDELPDEQKALVDTINIDPHRRLSSDQRTQLLDSCARNIRFFAAEPRLPTPLTIERIDDAGAIPTPTRSLYDTFCSVTAFISRCTSS